MVGYQNSGKTTFMNMLLSRLNREGIKTVTIKHHGHGGKPAVVEETDSAQHVSAGACASLVEGGGRMVLQTEKMDLSLEGQLQLMSMMKPDLIMIEGHKRANYPKLVFIRNQEELQLLNELKNIELVLFQEPFEINKRYHSFHRDDPNAVQWLVDYFHIQLEK